MSEAPYHRPVLAAELLAVVGHARRVVDGTLGDGGHAALWLERGAALLGIDRDPEAIRRARRRLGEEGIGYLQGSVFEPPALAAIRAFGPDLILLDLGVSSRQLDEDPLGFSFRPGARLDMRMGREGPTAADRLSEATQPELEEWFRAYGDEPRAHRLAVEIVRRRDRAPLERSDDLVNAIRAALGPRSGPADFARIFQAVRIVVNDELGGLDRALTVLRDALMPGGALAVISYHSGEDRLVKHRFREWSARCVCPPDLPVCACRGRPLGRILTRRPLVPSAAEVAENPRARSAKLRVFEVADGQTSG
jgi:16S rRNA (cytosine1402-N4)-methyltransferase